jgi:hypothetical protein
MSQFNLLLSPHMTIFRAILYSDISIPQPVSLYGRHVKGICKRITRSIYFQTFGVMSPFQNSTDDKVAAHGSALLHLRLKFNVVSGCTLLSLWLGTAQGWVDPRAVQMRYVVETAKLK